MTHVSMTVNGDVVEADIEPRTHLGDFLRAPILDASMGFAVPVRCRLMALRHALALPWRLRATGQMCGP